MAGKRKNPADNWMPPRVYRGKAAYEFRTKDNKAVRLCSLEETQAAVWLAYEKAVGEEVRKNTFQNLADMFMASPDIMDLSPETRKDYTKYSCKVLPVFGKTDPKKNKTRAHSALYGSAWYFQPNAGKQGKEFPFAGISLGL